MVMEYVHGRSVREILNARGAPRARPGRRGARPDARGVRARARARDRPPRPEAREHPHHDRRGREAHRPRARAGVRRREEHPGGRGHRHRPVLGPRADPRRAGRPALRPVLARDRRLRAAHRPLPFTGETPMAIAYKHLSDRVPSPSSVHADGVPADLDAFIASATDPDREMRPESAAAMRRDLATFSATLEGRARSPRSSNDVPRVVRDPRRRGEPRRRSRRAAITQSIPQVGRQRRRRGRGSWPGCSRRTRRCRRLGRVDYVDPAQSPGPEP